MTAGQVFVSTAVSQSGRLDTFLVLSLQTRMVWKIARLYNQRPSLREMVNLYANVAGTAFAAGEIQDVDLSEQIEPVFSAVIGSLGGAVPGFQLVASILANSVMSGAADAFLTLRVGMITKRYCGALVVEQPAALRQEGDLGSGRAHRCDRGRRDRPGHSGPLEPFEGQGRRRRQRRLLQGVDGLRKDEAT